MWHVVNVSGGVPSAIALERTIKKVGHDKTVAVFADVKIEDPDLYRFLDDVEAYLNHPIQRIAEGRTPWEVFFDEKMMGNNRADICSRILKREFLDNWIATQTEEYVVAATEPSRVLLQPEPKTYRAKFTPENTTRVFGFGVKELHRAENIRQVVAPYPVWIPLHESPLMSNCECVEYVRNEWGVDPPDLYDQGFPHNNCGGACVKAGHGQWYLAYKKRRAVFDMWKQKEQEHRAMTGKDVSILRDRRGGSNSPMPLTELQRRFEEEGYRPTDVRGGCDCMGIQQLTLPFAT